MNVFNKITSLGYILKECPLVLDFDKVCRVCLSRCNLHPIFKYCDELFQHPQDLSFVMHCLGNDVKEDDGLPDKICEKCINILRMILHFRKLIGDSNNRLKYALRKQNEKNTPTGESKSLDEGIPCLVSELKREVDKLECNEIETECDDFLAGETDEPEVKELCEVNDKSNNGEVRGEDKLETDVNIQNGIINSNQIHKLRCKVCNLDFNSEKIKLMHERKCSWTRQKGRSSQQDEQCHVSPLDEELRRIYGCTVCKKAFGGRSALKRHQVSHTKDQIDTLCTICGKGFASIYYLNSHMMTHKERSLTCDQCKYRTNNPNSLTLHKRTHSGERPYACEWCLYHSVNMSNLRKHQLTHTGVKNFVCSDCGKKYTCKRSLADHISSVHYKLRPYQCQVCENTYARRHTLRKHVVKVHLPKKKKR